MLSVAGCYFILARGATWAGAPPRLWLRCLCRAVAPRLPRLDWPQFLGPERNGVYRGPALAKAWPAESPLVWQRPVGQGFSGPVVSGDRLILHHRVGALAVVDCLDAGTGKELWRTEHPTDYRDEFGFDEGPRATPAIAGGRVFTFGAEGRLSCWSLADGAAVWGVDTQKEFGSPKGFFGQTEL